MPAEHTNRSVNSTMVIVVMMTTMTTTTTILTMIRMKNSRHAMARCKRKKAVLRACGAQNKMC